MWRIILLVLVSGLLLNSCICGCGDNLDVGKKYGYRIIWDDDNPFTKNEYEVVTITGKKDGYIQWKTSDGYVRSEKLCDWYDYFRDVGLNDVVTESDVKQSKENDEENDEEYQEVEYIGD